MLPRAHHACETRMAVCGPVIHNSDTARVSNEFNLPTTTRQSVVKSTRPTSNRRDRRQIDETDVKLTRLTSNRRDRRQIDETDVKSTRPTSNRRDVRNNTRGTGRHPHVARTAYSRGAYLFDCVNPVLRGRTLLLFCVWEPAAMDTLRVTAQLMLRDERRVAVLACVIFCLQMHPGDMSPQVP
jgi:hypothetical protein